MTTTTKQHAGRRTNRLLLLAVAFWLAMAGVAAAQTYATSTDPLTINPTGFAPGDSITVSGDGFEPGGSIEIVLVDDGADGAETVLATVDADNDGAFEVTVTIPDGYSGDGRIAARGNAPDGAQRILGDPAPSSSGTSLARTGSSVIPWVVGGVAAALLGSVLAIAARNRRRVTPIG